VLIHANHTGAVLVVEKDKGETPKFRHGRGNMKDFSRIEYGRVLLPFTLIRVFMRPRMSS